MGGMGGFEFGAAFVVGLLGSGHCLVMCGGVATALELAVAPGSVSRLASRSGYQTGRLLGYSAAGAVAGGLGSFMLELVSAELALSIARSLQAVMLILLGLYLSAVWRAPLATIERWGGRIWRAMGPLRSRLMPVRGFAGALRMGLLWGFLPCGLVYSALALSLASGSAGAGAMTMLAFGAGTLPAVVMISALVNRATSATANQTVRRIAGVLILASGVLMGLHAVQH